MTLTQTSAQSQDQLELDTILSEARAATRAEAGSLYLARKGGLKLVVVQNDRMRAEEIATRLLGKVVPISASSLAGFTAMTGCAANIADTHRLPPDLPYRINRDLDAETGYTVRSIMAIPLSRPEGGCVGVLELFNHLDANDNVSPFEEKDLNAIRHLASMAAIALHNMDLQAHLLEAHLNTIMRLAAVAEYRDADTGEHIQRVSRCSEVTAAALGLDPGQVELIKYASPMHDVGKVAIPDAILLKPGDLTPPQRAIMQRHTVVGAEILGDRPDPILVVAREVALTHHERWDGQGYPRGLQGDAIPLSGRIVGLVDVFDAIVSRRCYKQACSLDTALSIIEGDTGSHFDPAVAAAFKGALDNILESYPALKLP
jgi:putative two-component system response regulator